MVGDTYYSPAIIAYFGESFIPVALDFEWLAMVCFAVFGLLSTWLVFEGYKYVDASIGGLIGLFEVIFSILFGIFFFHESLSPSILIGGGVILFAAMLPDLVTVWTKSVSKKAN